MTYCYTFRHIKTIITIVLQNTDSSEMHTDNELTSSACKYAFACDQSTFTSKGDQAGSLTSPLEDGRR